MSEAIFQSICVRLDELPCPYEVIEHAPAETAEQAAEIRGTPLTSGIKSILFKTDDRFSIFAFSAGRALRSRLMRKHFGVKRTRFASRDELDTMLGILPGAVPPFGEPILPLPLYVDPSVFDQSQVVFTAGLRTHSITLASEDYRRAAAPEVFVFTRESN